MLDSSLDDDDAAEEQPYSIATNRQRRQIRPPQRYRSMADLVAYALTMAEKIDEPSSYSQAITSNESAQWIIAMNEEIESLHKN